MMSIEKFSEVNPRAVFCALGNWDEESMSEFQEIITKSGFEFDTQYSMIGNDERMENSFNVSADRVNYSFTEEDQNAIQSHTAVAYFLAPAAQDRASFRNIMGKALILVRYLFENLGVVALKAESQGISHGREKWISLSNTYAENSNEKTLYEAFVKKPLVNEYGMYTCGMHLLGLPDVLYYFDSGAETEMEAIENIDSIADMIFKYDGDYEKIEEEIEDSVMMNDCPKLIPCPFYSEDEFFYNPFGYVYVADE